MSHYDPYVTTYEIEFCDHNDTLSFLDYFNLLNHKNSLSVPYIKRDIQLIKEYLSPIVSREILYGCSINEYNYHPRPIWFNLSDNTPPKVRISLYYDHKVAVTDQDSDILKSYKRDIKLKELGI